MSTLIEKLEKLGSDASLSTIDEETIQKLSTEIENSDFPEIKSFIVVPAEDDEKDEQPSESDENKEPENILLMCSN